MQEALKARGLYTGQLDNWWGKKTDAAYSAFLKDITSVVYGLASTFADPADLQAYKRAIQNGATEEEALHLGDNGIGYWKDDTTTEIVPMCAFAKSTLKERFGTDWKTSAKHALVRVNYKTETIDCIVADCGAPEGRIDLNPGACKALGIQAGDLVPASWKWIT